MSSNTTTQCNVPAFVPIPDPVTFANTGIIERVHNRAPRYGHSSDIQLLFDASSSSSSSYNNNNNSSEYLIGAMAGAITMGAFIIVWIIAIFGLKCLGPHRVGIFSGRQVVPNKTAPGTEKEEEGQEIEIWSQDEDYHFNSDGEADVSNSHYYNDTADQERDRQMQRLNRARIAVLCCSVGIVVSSIIMVTKGSQTLNQSANSGLEGLQKAQQLTDDAIQIIDQFIAIEKNANDSIQSFLSRVNEICPAVTSQICTKLDTPQPECNFSNIPYGEDLQLILSNPQGIVYDQVSGMRADLVDLQGLLANTESSAQSFAWVFIVAAVFASLLALLNILISVGVITAWRNPSAARKRSFTRFLRSWVLIPLFGFLVICSWIFSMVFIVGSTMAADTCVDSPDERVQALLEIHGDSIDTVVKQFLLYYIQGCPADQVPSDLLTKVSEIQDVFKNVLTFINRFDENTAAEFQQRCGSDPSILTDLASSLENSVCDLANAMNDVQVYFSCGNWRPLYRIVLYDAVCYEGNTGFWYTSISQFCIVIFTMVMLTLRVAWTDAPSTK